MAFRFPLQTVLRLRRSLESQEEKKLLAIAASVARVKLQIEQFQDQNLRQRRAENEELASNLVIGSVLQFHAVCENRRRALHKELTEELATLESQRLEQIARYRVARQKREILEGLREHQKAAYDSQFTKREQQGMDEAFLIRLMQTERE